MTISKKRKKFLEIILSYSKGKTRAEKFCAEL